MKRYFIIVLLNIVSSIFCFSQTFMLFGGSSHDIFLGCLNVNNYNTDSVWNQYGQYGSEYNSKSIWNTYGIYGSAYSMFSPWNDYASDPPVIVDEKGNFYGYFTIKKSKNRTKIEWIVWIIDHFDYVKKNRNKVYDQLF